MCSNEIWFPEAFNRLTLSLWVTKLCPGVLRSTFKNKAREKMSELNNCGGKKSFVSNVSGSMSSILNDSFFIG